MENDQIKSVLFQAALKPRAVHQTITEPIIQLLQLSEIINVKLLKCKNLSHL